MKTAKNTTNQVTTLLCEKTTPANIPAKPAGTHPAAHTPQKHRNTHPHTATQTQTHRHTHQKKHPHTQVDTPTHTTVFNGKSKIPQAEGRTEGSTKAALGRKNFKVCQVSYYLLILSPTTFQPSGCFL